MEPSIEWQGIRVYVAAIQREADQTAREAERAAVSSLLQAVLGCDAAISHDAEGAPYIVGDDRLQLSVSHGAGCAVIALAERRPGVDIEAPRAQLERVERKFRNVGDSPLLSLLELWTAKEAVFKAAGIADLTVGQIAISNRHEAVVGHRKFDVAFFPLEGALIAVASERVEQREDVGTQGVDGGAQ